MKDQQMLLQYQKHLKLSIFHTWSFRMERIKFRSIRKVVKLLNKIIKNIKLHMLGKLQSNKVKHAVKIFDFHSVDSKKSLKKLLTS